MIPVDSQTKVLQSVASQLNQLFDPVAGGWAVIVLDETFALVRTYPDSGEVHLAISRGHDKTGFPVRSFYACKLNDLSRDL